MRKTFLIICLWVLSAGWPQAADGGLWAHKDPEATATNDLTQSPFELSLSGGSGFKAGSWTFQVYGSAAFHQEDGQVFTGHVGAGYYLWDDLSVNLEAIGGEINFDQGRQGLKATGSAWVVGLDLLVRWHLVHQKNWTAFLECGAGFQQSADPFPVGGTHFNFRPQFGLGITLDLGGDVRLLAGSRWLHISNADKDGHSHNPGYDGAMVYTGLMISF